MKRINLATWLLCSAISFLVIACKKEEATEGTSQVYIRMTDAPANYNAVYIDLQAVEVTGSGGKNTQLNVNPGIYNLLDFVNGADTLIASGGIPAGKVEQIRLILGSNNSIMVDSVIHPLSTPSAQQSGLKIQVHKNFADGVSYILLLDFDANQSVVEQGNGQYSLKPVIRLLDAAAMNGSIAGTVSPASTICSITADNGSTTLYSTYSDSTGGFLIPGVPAGSYDLYINPPAPAPPDTVFNVSVINGQITNVGIIQL